MKKKLLLFIMLLLIPFGVKADNIKNIDMKIYIDESGEANVTEEWTVKASSGTEWYKSMYNLGNSNLTDFVVYMDGEQLQEKKWNVNASLKEKSNSYGINYTYDGIELCFGKTDFKEHVFKLTYNLSNYIFNTSDSQVLYWTLMPNITMDKFSVEITSYYSFPDTLEVWGYGYKGYAYVKDGKISMSNEGSLNDNYITLLAKFPLDTFKTENSYSQFQTFDDVHNLAEEGTFEYEYEEEKPKLSTFEKIISVIIGIFVVLQPLLIFGVIILVIVLVSRGSGYGFVNNKKIDKKTTPMFRDIPCGKNIYYANALASLNKIPNYQETNIMGAIILKWVREDKIRFITKESTGLFKKETSQIDLTMNPTFDNPKEQKLFEIMYEASVDGILETKELEKWCRKNYNKFLNSFRRIREDEISNLKSTGHIYKRNSKEECKYKNVMDDTIYKDSSELYGLKLFLEEFSRMNTKEVMEVKLWDEYLMFAYIFGIADKVAKQLKDLYPEVLEDPNARIDYNTIVYVSNISRTSTSSANSARAAAESYSSGGGGFSSGGGGGGSFGGGGGAGGR